MAEFVRSYSLPILDRSGKPYDVSNLSSADVIAFYFSAQWCPPCKHFTPILKKFVEMLESYGDKSLKIIFVSSDHAEHEMWKYMYDSHGDWLALAHSCKEGKERLERQYQVSGIPQLVVIDSVGRWAVRDARGEVMAAVNGSSTQILTTYLKWKTAAGVSAGAPTTGPTSSTPCNQLPFHTRVRVRGLTGAPEHNGAEGTIGSYDSERERYVVELADKSLALRAANLLQLLKVKIRSGQSEDWLDGEIANFDEAAGKIEFKVDGQARHASLGDAEGPVLNAGARLTVHGLQAESAKQWNECMGEVLEYDEKAGRYLLQVSPTEQLKVRPVNVRLCPL